MSFLMPTAVRPAVGQCGTYVALGSSNGDRALSGITQVVYSLEGLLKFLVDCCCFNNILELHFGFIPVHV